MAGLQEVLTASASGQKQIWTLLLEGDATAPPETRESDSVDGLLETAAACVNCAPTALKVHVLLPGGDGEGTVAGGDAVVLFHGCLLYTSPSPRDRQKSRMPSSA